MRLFISLAIILLVTSPAWAGSQPIAPLTSGAAVHLTSTTLGTTQSTVLATDRTRGFLQIQNVGTNTNILACTLDGTAPVVGGNGIQLSGVVSGAGGSATYDTFVPNGPVICIGSGSGTGYVITYLP